MRVQSNRTSPPAGDTKGFNHLSMFSSKGNCKHASSPQFHSQLCASGDTTREFTAALFERAKRKTTYYWKNRKYSVWCPNDTTIEMCNNRDEAYKYDVG